MHGTAKHVADRQQDEDDGAELDTENHADYRADACNVQKLDEDVFPVRHGDAVNAIRIFEGGSLAVIGAEDTFNEFSVSKVSADKNRDTNQECNHVMPSFLGVRSGAKSL